MMYLAKNISVAWNLGNLKGVSELRKVVTHGSAAASGNPATNTGDGKGEPGCASPPSSTS